MVIVTKNEKYMLSFNHRFILAQLYHICIITLCSIDKKYYIYKCCYHLEYYIEIPCFLSGLELKVAILAEFFRLVVMSKINPQTIWCLK